MRLGKQRAALGSSAQTHTQREYAEGQSPFASIEQAIRLQTLAGRMTRTDVALSGAQRLLTPTSAKSHLLTSCASSDPARLHELVVGEGATSRDACDPNAPSAKRTGTSERAAAHAEAFLDFQAAQLKPMLQRSCPAKADNPRRSTMLLLCDNYHRPNVATSCAMG